MPQQTAPGEGISIHAPRAGGDGEGRDIRPYDSNFNPRPPCGGRQHGPARGSLPIKYFNPRPPCGGRPWIYPPAPPILFISIHAPRAGGDQRRLVWRFARCYFNPRPPCGGRQELLRLYYVNGKFQSTPPVRGATKHLGDITKINWDISIHAPRAGGDGARPLSDSQPSPHFNPRPPCGGRRMDIG